MQDSSAVTAVATTSPLPREPQAAKYDAYRSQRLDELRQKKGRAYVANRSLIVMDALDLLLKAEGMLPADAPLLSTIQGGGT